MIGSFLFFWLGAGLLGGAQPGTVVAWGHNNLGQTTLPPGLTNVVGIAAGDEHSLAVRSDGRVIGWGDNGYGEASPPATLTDAVAVSAGYDSSLALRPNGVVALWGYSSYGLTTLPAGLTNVVAVQGGTFHNLALQADGRVVGWGYGGNNVPAGLSDVIEISAGGFHSMGLKADGTVVTWGYYDDGIENQPLGLANVVAVSVGDGHRLALLWNGTVVAWGDNSVGQTSVPPGLTNVVGISAGRNYSLALRSDGTVVAWGVNDYGQATPPMQLGDVVAISAGGFHGLALLGDGSPVLPKRIPRRSAYTGATVGLNCLAVGAAPLAYQWQFDGQNLPGATKPFLLLSNVQPSDTGSYSVTVRNALGNATAMVAALSVDVAPPQIVFSSGAKTTWAGSTIDFEVVAEGSEPLSYQWMFNGRDLAGATEPALVLKNVRIDQAGLYSVRVGNAFGTATSSNALLLVQNLIGWGNNGGGESDVPEEVTNVIAIAPAPLHNVALRSDGTVVAWGDNRFGQTDVPPDLTQATAVAAGYSFSLALRPDGSVAAWGANDNGQLDVPAGLKDAVAISGGNLHALALRSDGAVVAWGNDAYGQTDVPPSLTNVVAVSAGVDFSVALRADGAVVSWGRDAYARGAVPVGLSQVVDVAAGGQNGLALKADGTVAALGTSWRELNIPPPGLSNVVAVAAGGGHMAALQADGNVVVWGSNRSRQMDIPPGLTNVIAIAAGEYQTFAVTDHGVPAVVSGQQHRVGYTGEKPVLNAGAVGAPPLRYQWAFGGIPIQGATNATLVLPDLQFSAAGTYTVSVANALGLATRTIELEVRDAPPEILRQPESRRVYAGAGITLEAWAIGSQPIAYRWFLNGEEIPGATNASLELPRVLFSDVGDYVVRAQNRFGTVTSEAAAITIPSAIAWGSYADGNPNDYCYEPAYVPTNLPRSVVELTGGDYHSLALLADGTARTWGSRCYLQSRPDVPADLTNAIAVSAGPDHNLALRSDGTVTAWGSGWEGITNVPPDLSNVVAIAAGWLNNLAVKSDGTVVAWGSQYVSSPPPDVFDAVAVAVAKGNGNRNLALRADGTVVGWPSGNEPPAGLSNVVAIAAGRADLALKADGTVAAWGLVPGSDLTNVPSGLSNVVGIAAGEYENVALGADGKVTTWGLRGFDLDALPRDLTNVTAIGSGSFHALARLGIERLVRLNDFQMARFHWRSIGDAPWFGQAVVTYDGGEAARSGRLLDGQESRLQTTVAGPGTLTFWWKVSSEESRDFVSFRVNGVESTRISGEVDWQMQRVDIPEGLQTLEWRYSKDGGGASGADAAWLDRVQFAPRLAPAPLLALQPRSQTIWEGTPVALETRVRAVEPWRLQWRFNGVDLPGATNEILSIQTARPADAGVYSVVVTNRFGAVTSLEAALTVTNSIPRPFALPTGPVTALGQQIVFYATNTAGGPPFSYQWQFNRRDISGAVKNSLVLHPTRFADAGYYDVVVENNLGSAASPPTLLTVVPFFATGRNDEGQTNWGPVVTNAITVAASYDFNAALRADGTVVAWPKPAPALSNVVALAGSFSSFALALRSDGTVTGWGQNYDGQLNIPLRLTNAVFIAAGSAHALAVTAGGIVVGWGRNTDGVTDIPMALSNVVAVAAGNSHSVALRRDGTVVSWGQSSFVPPDLPPVVAIAAGGFYTLALLADGTVRGWNTYGDSYFDIPAGLTNVVAVAAGGSHSLALTADGKVVGWGNNTSGQIDSLSTISNAVSIAGGSFHSLVLLAENEWPLPARVSPEAFDPRMQGHRFSVRVPSVRGRVYTLEFKNSLSDPSWTPLPMVVGDGSELLLSDPNATTPHRFYRVSQPSVSGQNFVRAHVAHAQSRTSAGAFRLD